jgi:hypothetical protein
MSLMISITHWEIVTGGRTVRSDLTSPRLGSK